MFVSAVRRLLKDGVFFNLPVVCLLVAGLLSVDFSPLQPVARAAGQTNPDSLQSVVRLTARQHSAPLQARESGGFLITMRNGERVCEEAPRALIAEVQRRAMTQSFRQISSRASAVAQPLPASGLKISLRGTAQLDQHPHAKEAFIRAAAVWEARIESPLVIVINVDFGEKVFDGNDNPNDDKPFGQDVVGVTTTQLVGSDDIYDLVRDQLINTARTPARPSLLSLLPTRDLPTDLGRTTALFGPAAIFRALGIISPVADPGEETADLGPPPAIAFNSKFAYDFDPQDGIDPGKLDFEATAVHEIGHALGFISNVVKVGEDEYYGPAPIDLFRFRPDVSFPTFTTANRIQSPGGEQIFFASGTKLPLSTARPNGKDGDGSQASHWKDDVLAGQYLGIMDPSLSVGRRQVMTENDLLAFASLGYRMRPFDRPATEELSVDEEKFSGGIPGDAKSMMVNRLTPSAYPARLESIRIHFAQFPNLPNPTGAPIRLVAFAGPPGATTPPANPQLLVDRVVAVPPITSSQGSQGFFEFPLSNGPVITEGDFYVGFQRVGATAQNSFSGIYFDVEAGEKAQRRSFLSHDNGATFSGPLTDNDQPVNALIRARVATGRKMRLGTVVSPPDREISVPLEMISKADEARLDFSIEFDRNILEFVRAETVDAGLTLKSNDSQIAQGRIGVSLSANGTLQTPGLRPLARAVFRLKAGIAPGTSAISFVDQPTPRAIFTLAASPLEGAAAFINGKVVIAEMATVASAASFASTEVAPESIAAAFGTDLAIGARSSSSVPLPAALLGTTVEIHDSRGQQLTAPLFFVSGGQINFQVPAGAAAGTATAIIRSGDERVSLATFRIANLAPGLFAANSDGKDAAAANIVRLRNGVLTYEPISQFDATQGKFVLLPIDLGPEGDQIFLVLYGSGLRFRPENSAVSGVIGGLPVPVAFIGPAGGFIGLDQVNIGPLPRALVGRGIVEVQLTVDGKMTNTVQVAFK